MNPNNLHGDRYGFDNNVGNNNNNIGNDKFANNYGGNYNNNNNTPSNNNSSIGLGSSVPLENQDNNPLMNDHNVFMKVQSANGSYSNEKIEENNEKNHLRIVFIIAAVLLLLIVVAIASVLFLK